MSIIPRIRHFFTGLVLVVCSATVAFAAPEPSVTTNLDQQGFIGENACFQATFSHANETGYGPYLLMTVPDDIDTSSISATLFDGNTTAAVTHVGEIDSTTASYPANPYDNSTTPTAYTAPDPGHLLLIDLPLGSMTSATPDMVLDICLDVPDNATQGDTLPIQLTPGYRYGDSPTGTDTITGTATDASAGITPVLAMAKKENTTQDGERTPGSSYPFNYLLAVDIAKGETLDNIVITDVLPANVQRTADAITVGGSNSNSSSACTVSESGTSNGGGTVSITCASLTGIANAQGISNDIGGDDILITIPVYTRDILDESACSSDVVQNSLSVTANHNGSAIPDINLSEATGYTAVTAALQKSADDDTPNPDTPITYTLAFQISDYTETASNTDAPTTFTIVDTLPDGLTFTSGSATLNLGGSSIAVTPTVSTTAGVTTVTYDVVSFAAANGLPLHAGSSGSITYSASVAQSYNNGAAVTSNDPMTNNATLTYQLADASSTCSNTANETVRITEVKPNKRVMNIGDAPFQAGDIIYYQVQITLESGDAQNVNLTDILPLPAHSVTDGDLPIIGNIIAGTDVNQTDPNNYVYHANVTNGASGVSIEHFPPTVSLDTTGNATSFDFGNVSTNPTQSVTLTVNIPAKVSDKPFADDLSLTNLLQVSADNSTGTATVAAGVASVTTIAPVVQLTKGVLSTSNSNATINPAATTLPVNGDLTNADAGDQVTYRLTVENTGKGNAFDVVVTDTIPTELQSCSVSNVTQGNGTVLSAGTGYTTSITASQVQVTLANDIISNGGALNSNDETPDGGGSPYSDDTVFIDVTCTLADSVAPEQAIENTANITWSSAVEADTYPNQEDTATVTIAKPDVAKTLTAVTPNGTGLTDFSQVTAGDTVTYDITVTLPEGTINNLTLTDTLPSGFSYVANSATVINGSFSGTLPTPSITTSGQNVVATFSSDTITTGSNATANNTFILQLQALVNDDTANDGLPNAQSKSNRVTLTYTGQGSGTISDTAITHFVEPELDTTKFRRPSGRYGVGDWVTFRFRVRNTGTAPAYDVVVSDILNGNIFDLSTVQNVTTVDQPTSEGWTGYSMTGFDYAYDATSGTATFSQQAGRQLNAGASRNFKIKVQIKAGVPANSRFTNSVTVNGDSQDGVVDNERASTDTHQIVFDTDLPEVGKTILSTSEAWTTTPEVAIGEIVTYQVIYDIPEGQTLARTSPANLIFQDFLPTGFRYLDGTARYYGVHDGRLSASNLSGTIPTTSTAVPNDKLAVAIANRRLRFLFGDIINSDNDGDTSVEQIILTYQAIVQNTDNNNRTDSKNNTARLLYQNVAGNTRQRVARASVSIAEPNLTISKTANPTTADGGDTVTFNVVISNPSGTNVTRAWDVVAQDPLPGQYDQLNISSVTLGNSTATRSALDWLSCTHVTSPAASTYRWDFDMNNCPSIDAEQHYLAPDETLTITYTGRLAPTVAFGASITNTAEVQATSLPGDNGTSDATPGTSGTTNGERTGNGSGENDLVATDTADVSIETPSIEKTVADNTLQIGEQTTVTLTVSLPVGTTDDFVITDILPAGLRYTGGDITVTKQNNLTVSSNNVAVNSVNQSLTNGINTISGISAVSGDGNDASLTFDFGTITVTAGDGITITYPVQVENVSGNQRNQTLSNTAALAYDGYDSANPPQSSATITVIEPNIEVAKSIVSGASNSVAGDTIRYQFTVSNNDTVATAYRVQIADVVPPELLGTAPTTFSNVGLSNSNNVVISGTSTDVTATDYSITTTTNTDDTLLFDVVDMPPSSSVTVTYDVKVTNTAAVGTTLTNNLSVDYHSLPNGNDGRDGTDVKDDEDNALNNYGETTSASVTLDSSIALQKTLTGTPTANTYAIGEEVSYDLRIDILEGTTNNVVITDTLPVGMTFIEVDNGLEIPTNNTGLTYSAGSVSATQSGSGTTADPHQLTINLGNIVNSPDSLSDNDYVVVTLTLRVDNHVDNDSGDTLTNTASVTSDNAGSDNDSQDITVVEPKLTVEKNVNNTTPALGEIVTYTVTVKHDVGSNSDAYNVVLSDVPATGLTYVGNLSGAALTSTTPLTFDLGTITQTDMQKSFTYQMRVEDTATVGTGLDNAINGSYSSMAGDDPNERTGSGSPVQNDYTFATTETVTPDTNAVIDASKTVAIAVDNGTSGVADIGDTLQYTVTLTNTGSSDVTNVVFTDSIPANTTLVTGSLTSSVGTATEGDPIVVNDIATLAPNASVAITFRVTIDANTATGTVISNQGVVDSNETVPEPTDEDGVDANGDQPTDIAVGGNPTLENPLYAEKAVELWADANSNQAVNAGDTLRYTIVLNNQGNNDLTNVILSDVIPSGLTYVNSTAVASSGLVNVSGQDLDWTGITTIPAGGFVNVVFDVTVNSFTGADKTFDNQGDVSYTDGTTNKTTKTDSNGNGSDGNQPTTITATTGTGAPALDVQKRVTLATDSDNNGVANPGDTLTYTITIVNNGSAATNNARFSDTIPTQTALVSGSVTTDYGVVTSAVDPIAVNLGSLQPGEVATIRFSITVKANTGGETASNQASVSGDNFTDTNSDDNGNSSDGINPTLMPIYDAGNTPPTAVSKSIVTTSQTASTGNNVLIGEIVTYEITVPMPTGNLAQATVVDTLPSGLGYVANSAKLKRVFSTGLNASADPNGINTASSDSYITLTDGSSLQQDGQVLSVFLGDVINSDSVAASYTLQYQAVVKNIAANVNATALSNSAQLNYLNGLNQATNLAADDTTVTVKEPHLTINKTAAPDVVLTTGGTVTFTIAVENDGTAPAYDINVTDTMPSGWTIANVNTGGTATNTSTSTTLQVVIDELAIGASQTLTVTVTAPSGLTDGSTITNTAKSTWSSLSGNTANAGDEDGERTGDSGSGSNGYSNNDSASVKVGTPNVSKTVLNPLSRYAIGDTVNYQVTVTVPAGLNMADSIFTDVLASGLQYVDNSLTVSLDGLTLATQPSDFVRVENTTTGEETLTFDSNGIRNTHSDTRTLTLTYSARVENITANQNNSSLSNTANVAYTNPGDTSQTLNLSDNQSMTVGEPHLQLAKTITTPTTNLDAGDSVTYEITVSNNGTTTAFDTVLSDSLPDGLENITALSITSTTPPTLTLPTLTISGTNNDEWSSSAFDLSVGESLTISFTATLANSVTPGDTLQNRVNAEFSSQSGNTGNERGGDLSDTADQDDNSVLDNYDVSATSATITVADPIQFDKAFNPTTKTTYTIGELVNYRLTLKLAQGTLDDVVIEDTLPSGLTYVSGSVGVGHTQMTASNGTNVTAAGQVITADLGQVINPANNIDNDDFITVDITARVDNITANQDGTVLGNQAEVRYTDATGAQTREFDADSTTAGNQPLDLTIVEPNLSIGKTASVNEISLGDVVMYTITVAHTSSSTATAYDVVVSDVIPSGMSYVANSGTPTPTTVSGQTLTFTVPSLASGSTTITYQAQMNTDTAVGATQTNNATLTYASQAGANGAADNGRNGKDGTGNLNDYTDSASVPVTPTANNVIDATKTVVLTDDSDGDGVADAGETLTYTVTLENTGSDKVTDVVFTDTLPSDTTYVVGSLNAVGSTAAATNGNDITIEYDELAAGTSVTITFDATIKAGTATGTLISNQGSVDSNETVPEPTDQDGDDSNGDQPTDIRVGGDPTPDYALTADKTVALLGDNDGNSVVSPGDTLRYTIVLNNDGTQTLTGLTFSDTIPSGLTYTGDNNPSSGSVSVSVQDLTWNSIADLAVGASTTLTFDVTIDTFTGSTTSETFVNQGSASSTETGTVQTDSNGDSSDGEQPTTITATNDITTAEPILDVQKRVALFTDNNANGVANPADQLRYTITVSNVGAVTAENARLSDSIPTYTTLVGGSVTTSLGIVSSGNADPINVNIGDLPAGGTATVTFVVNVDNTTPNGTVIANQANVDADNLNTTANSDDNGNNSDGINPTLTPVYDNSSTPPTAVSKTIVASSEADSTGNSVLIGEVLTYEIRIELPTGNVAQASIADTLPDGLAYLANSAKLKRLFSTGLTASADPAGINTAASDTYVDLADGTTVVASGQALSVGLGDVINSDSVAASYTLQYQAVVKNIAANQDGTALSNSANLHYRDGLNQAAQLTPATTTATVIEPAVNISKTAEPMSILPSGGTVVYTVVIENNGNAPAYDVVIADDMPSGWNLQSVNSPADMSDNSDLTTEQIRLSLAKLNNGDSRTITYTVASPTTLAVGDAVDNTVNATWSSLPDDNGTGGATTASAGSENGERNHDTATNATNDYSDNSTATVSVGVPVLAKTVVNPQNRYAIGDTVTYQVQLAIPSQMRLDNHVMNDVLDDGLTYVDGTLSIDLDGLTATQSPSDFTRSDNTPTTGKETLTANFGQLYNSHSDTKTLVLRYQAVVDNQLSNQDGQALANHVSVDYTAPGTTTAADSLTATASVTVGEPHVVLSKAIPLSSPTTDLQAGDSVTYEVNIANDGSTTAFNTIISDTLPDGLQTITNLVVSSSTPSTLTPPTLTITGNTWSAEPFNLAVGESLTLQFTATLADSVQPQQSIQNTVTARFDSQADNSGRGSDGSSQQDDDTTLNNYEVQANAPTFTVGDPIQFDKAFYPDRSRNTYTIGETVSYRLTLSLLEGTLNQTVISDTLPDGMTFVDAHVGVGHSAILTQYSGSPSQSGQVLYFDLGSIENPANGDRSDDYLTIDIRAIIDNISDNQDGTTLGNHAEVSYVDANNQPRQNRFDADATDSGVQPLTLNVVEPMLAISKTVDTAEVSLGDVVTFTLNVAHTADSGADAFGVVIRDTLPAGLTYVPTATPTPTHVDGQTLTFELAALTQADGQATLTYQARVATTAAIGQALTNRAELSYRGQAVANADTRDGSDGTGGVNDYVGSASADVTPTANTALDAQKIVAITNDIDADGKADVSDTLTYTVTLHNTGTQTLNHVVFTDTLPNNTTFAGNLIAVGAASATENNGVISVNYDELPANTSATITFDVLINTGTAIGTVISNQGSVDSDETVPELTDQDGFDANGDQPTTIQVGGDTTTPTSALAVSKTYAITDDSVAPIGTNNVGDEVTYTLNIGNTGSTALTNVVLTDTVPSSVTVTDVSSSKGTTSVSNNVVINLGTLAVGESVTVQIVGTLNAVGTVDNQATVSSDELPEVLSDSDGDNSNGSQPTSFPVLAANQAGTPNLQLDKVMTLAVDTNSDGEVNPGESVKVSLTVSNNGTATAENVRLSDDLSAINADVLTYSITASQGTIINQLPILQANVGNLPAGNSATVSFIVLAKDIGTIDNTATASDNSGQSVSDSATLAVTALDPFDPPSGEKTVNADGIPELAWKQVWINPNHSYLMPVRIVDGIPANSTYVDGSIACEARGISTQSRCEFDTATQQVIFEGTMGADGTATTEDTAQNEVVITFRVSVDDLALQVSNQAEAQWDANGNGDLSDDSGIAVSNDPDTGESLDPTTWTPAPTPAPTSIPLLTWQWLLLVLLLVGITGGYRLRQRNTSIA